MIFLMNVDCITTIMVRAAAEECPNSLWYILKYLWGYIYLYMERGNKFGNW